MWKLDVLMSSKSYIDILSIITRYEILQVAPGDVVEMSGIFLPMPYFGFRAMRAGLVADTYLEAMSITHFKKKYEE
jgi:DNA replicative helicase MCM subunit Mcm2 (Cdc46/Mcm family)